MTNQEPKDVLTGIYKHYKGKYYLVLGLATHSETLEKLVVYIHLYVAEGTAIWVRPFKMFFETVEVNGKKVPRFLYIGSEMPKEEVLN